MKQYLTGFITAVCLTASTFLFIGAQRTTLGDIVVNSIVVRDNGRGGYIATYNEQGKETAYLGTGKNGVGFLRTSDAYGNQWIRDPAFKKRNGWRPISEEKFNRLASHVQLFVAVVRNTIQEHKSLESFCESVCKVNKYQWSRSQMFLRKDFKMSHFKKWTQKNHKDLEPLR